MGGPGSGRRGKTRAQHELAGTLKGAVHDYRNPEPPRGDPQPPQPLEGKRLAVWRRTVEHLRADGTLFSTHGDAIAQYVELWVQADDLAGDIARMRRVAADLEESAPLEAARALESVRKMGTELRQKSNGLRLWLVEFGQTPAAMARVKMPRGAGTGGQAEDPMAEFDPPGVH